MDLNLLVLLIVVCIAATFATFKTSLDHDSVFLAIMKAMFWPVTALLYVGIFFKDSLKKDSLN